MNVGDRRDRWTAEAPTLDALLDQFLLWCAASTSCPFAPGSARTQATVTAAYDALVAQLDAAPMATTAGPLDSAFFAVSALDLPLPAGYAQTDLEAFLATSIAPLGPRVGLVSAINELPAYVGWPYTPPKPIPAIAAPTSPPALVTATAYDIVPLPWAAQMQAALGAGSSLVTYQGVGHVNAGAVPCLGQIILAYLLDPETPPATTTCPAVPF